MISRTFFKLFPPPKFLTMPYAGVHISDMTVRMIHLVPGRHGLVVAKWAICPLTPGMVESGYIKDEAGVKKIVAEAVKHLGVSFVRIAVPEEKTYLFSTEIPYGTEKEIQQAIEFKLEENVPIAAADAIFYFDKIPDMPKSSSTSVAEKFSDKLSDKHFAMVSAAPRKVVDIYLSVFEGSGVTPIAVEVDARALARTFSKKENPDIELVVNIMKTKTELCVTCKGVAMFTSTVQWGGEALTAAIQNEFNISYEEALALKRAAGYHEHKDTKRVFSAVREKVGGLQQEISKVYAYWLEHGEGCKDIHRILLCGADALLVGMMSTIAPDAKIPVQVGNVWTNAFSNDKYIPPINFDDSLDFAVAIGLALPF